MEGIAIQQLQIVEREEFFKMIGADPLNATAVGIWDTLQANNCKS
jgi:hypothetical protein